MSNCPRCSYKLVFLEHRLRYKCAKCGRVFLQKFIENKDFRQWNRFQRDLDKNKLELKENQIKALLEERRIFRGLKLLFKEKRTQLSPEERKERRLLSYIKYYYKNKDKKNLQKKEWRLKNKEYYHNYMQKRRESRIIEARQEDRLSYWRKRQRDLIQQELEFNGYNFNNSYLKDSFSTFGLSDQLCKGF